MFGENRFKIKASYILMPVFLMVMLISYFYSGWAQSRRYDASLPRDGTDSLIKALMTYKEGAGRFPLDFKEVEERVWKRQKPPNYGESGRTFLAFNYHYIYFPKDNFTCTLWALPAGPRRAEASSYFFYITPDKIRKWKGPDMSEDDIKKLRPLPDSSLLGVMGMTEQESVAVKPTSSNGGKVNVGR